MWRRMETHGWQARWAKRRLTYVCCNTRGAAFADVYAAMELSIVDVQVWFVTSTKHTRLRGLRMLIMHGGKKR